jgi:hypothetical protein
MRCSVARSSDFSHKLRRRLRSNIIRASETLCWLWRGSRQTGGYGQISIAGQRWLAHRAAWRAWRGEIPHGLNVLHICDNRRCINPKHLFLGTARDNYLDAVQKGRMRAVLDPRHTRKPRHNKLTDAQVSEIRRWRAHRMPLRQIAERYGISITHVHQIATYKRKAHVL